MEETIERFLAGVVRERGLSPNTVAAYRNDIEQFRSFLGQQYQLQDWSELRTEHLEAFLAFLRERQYAETTAARKLAAIKSFCHSLLRSGQLAENSITVVPTPRAGRFAPRAIAPEAVQQLIIAASGDRFPEQLRDRAMLLTLATTGLRVSELTALDLADVDLEQGELLVRKPQNRDRRVPLPPDAVQALRVYLERGRPAFAPAKRETALFLNRRGTRLTRQGFWLILKGYAEAVGLADVTPHTLRHTFAVHALANGRELREVQRILGHVSPTTTQVYRQLLQQIGYPDGRVSGENPCYHEGVSTGASPSPRVEV